MIYAYLGCNIVVIQAQLLGIASLIKEMSGKTACVTDSTHCINKAILCSEKDVDHVSEEVLKSRRAHLNKCRSHSVQAFCEYTVPSGVSSYLIHFYLLPSTAYH
jgi:hypothetical protein